MKCVFSKLTVYFEDPFWVGMYERQCGSEYEACKITFGAEPKDYEVYALLLSRFEKFRFTAPEKSAQKKSELKRNPKRMQREIHRQLNPAGVGTKAQQAMQLAREQGKKDRKISSREHKELEQKRRLALRQKHQKEKHKGH